ncbi:nucleotide exchange factor GrpE [Anoxybacter fermentans]|uniref:Protein GrpE n=1 Tax=Anoxybacter fermentans TaxID=1323375 RepID=A0A3S9T2S8_9FIRM|nr:nucleotide exchange factor GrpE [Anoxybacter fermentans]
MDKEQFTEEQKEKAVSDGEDEAEVDEAEDSSVENTDTDKEAGEEKSPEVLALEEEKKKLEEEKKNLIDKLSRLQADFNNYRRRVAQEMEEHKARANERLLAELLPIIDNFERALSVEQNNDESFVKGVEMIYKQLLNLLEKEGVTPIEAEGEIFDPHLHHAVMKEPAPEGVVEDTIIAVLQKGYYYKGRVLRPAMVKVAE